MLKQVKLGDIFFLYQIIQYSSLLNNEYIANDFNFMTKSTESFQYYHHYCINQGASVSFSLYIQFLHIINISLKVILNYFFFCFASYFSLLQLVVVFGNSLVFQASFPHSSWAVLKKYPVCFQFVFYVLRCRNSCILIITCKTFTVCLSTVLLGIILPLPGGSVGRSVVLHKRLQVDPRSGQEAVDPHFSHQCFSLSSSSHSKINKHILG